MRLTKNPEAAALLRRMLLLLALALLLAWALSEVGLRMFHRAAAANQAAIIGAVLEHDPDARREILSQVRTPDEAAVRRGRQLLDAYGYTDQDLMPHTALLRHTARLQRTLYLGLAAAVFTALAAVFLLFLRKQYRTIREVHAYARAITEGNVQLDPRDNDEGEFSLLKNEIYKMTAMLKEQTERLKEDKRGLADSIADISHQLKTPLTSLSVLTDLLEDNPDASARREFVQRIRSQLNRIEWLVTSLLKLSKLDAGTVTLKRETFPLRTLIDNVLDTLGIPLEIHMLSVVRAGDESALLTADPGWTSEALINIIKNCIEHTPAGGEIRITCEDNPIFTKIIIADSGSGIDPKDLPYIFNRFYKGRNAKDDSVGIGLAMAHAIIRKQDGDITVRSEPGRGTVFTVTFYKRTI